MAVSYVMAAIGFIFQMADSVSNVIGTDDFKSHLSDMVGGDAEIVGRWFMAISVIVMIARLRGLLNWGDKKRDNE